MSRKNKTQDPTKDPEQTQGQQTEESTENEKATANQQRAMINPNAGDPDEVAVANGQMTEEVDPTDNMPPWRDSGQRGPDLVPTPAEYARDAQIRKEEAEEAREEAARQHNETGLPRVEPERDTEQADNLKR